MHNAVQKYIFLWQTHCTLTRALRLIAFSAAFMGSVQACWQNESGAVNNHFTLTHCFHVEEDQQIKDMREHCWWDHLAPAKICRNQKNKDMSARLCWTALLGFLTSLTNKTPLDCLLHNKDLLVQMCLFWKHLGTENRHCIVIWLLS